MRHGQKQGARPLFDGDLSQFQAARQPRRADTAQYLAAGQGIAANGEHLGELRRSGQTILAGGAVDDNFREAPGAEEFENRAKASGIQFAIREAGNQDCCVDTLNVDQIRHGPSYSARRTYLPLAFSIRAKA